MVLGSYFHLYSSSASVICLLARGTLTNLAVRLTNLSGSYILPYYEASAAYGSYFSYSSLSFDLKLSSKIKGSLSVSGVYGLVGKILSFFP